MKDIREKRKIRHLKIRKKVKGNQTRPRLSVFRSNKHIYAQIIDDNLGKTLVAASDKNSKGENKIQKSWQVGHLLATKALKKNIKKIVFDRASYKYNGRVKALAEGARKGGLVF